MTIEEAIKIPFSDNPLLDGEDEIKREEYVHYIAVALSKLRVEEPMAPPIPLGPPIQFAEWGPYCARCSMPLGIFNELGEEVTDKIRYCPKCGQRIKKWHKWGDR